MRNLIFVLVLFCGCEWIPTPAPKIDEHDAKAKASVSILVTEMKSDSQPSPQPDDAPKPGDKCSTCKGTGKVGDGRVFSKCLDCNGTGIVPESQAIEAEVTNIPAPVPAPVTVPVEVKPFQPATPAKEAVIVKKKLVVYSASWCGPCQQWKTNYADKFRQLGVEVIPIDIDAEIKPIYAPGGKEVKNIPFFVYYENDVPIKWFQGPTVSPDYLRANGVKL